jgi:hypothetical protein
MTIKRGRPKLNAADRRSGLLAVRFTLAEQRYLKGLASKNNMRFSAWIRQKLLGNHFVVDGS